MSTLTYGEERTEKEKKIDAEVKQRVEAGLVTLQRKFGDDWVEKIDLDKLDLGSASCCVIGQLYGRYDEGVEKHFDLECKNQFNWNDPLVKKSLAHGFVDRGGCNGYNRLTDEWQRRIIELRDKLGL